jgi:hypothetical protein
MSGLQSLKKTENNITKFEIYPNSGGKPIEISQGVVKLSYYENILSETIRITLMVVDTGNVSADSGTSGIDDILKIGNGEKVFLDFEDGDSRPNKLKFSKEDNALYLTEKEKISEHTQKAVYRIELVSKEYLKNEHTRVIKRYDGKISESVRKILTEVLETKKELDIELTDNNFNFIGTNKKPIWTILWLAKKSIPQKENSNGKSAGYFFFETYDGFKFKSIDSLVGGTGEGGSTASNKTRYKSYIFNNTTSSVVPIGYDGKILDYDSANSGDLQSKLMMGTYNSANKGFDARESAYGESPIDIETQEEGITIAGTEFNFVNKIFTEAASRFSYSFKAVGFLPEGKDLQSQLTKSRDLDIDKGTTINQAASRYNQIFTVQLKITIAGDFSLRAGDLIYCDFPELTSNPTAKFNPRLSGVYLISSLHHHLAPNETYTFLELIRDSYGRKPKQT